MKHLLVSILLLVCVCFFIYNTIIICREGLDAQNIYFNILQNERGIQGSYKELTCINSSQAECEANGDCVFNASTELCDIA